MPNTPLGFPYSASTDAPAGYSQEQALALAIDTYLSTLAGRVSTLYNGTPSAQSLTSGTLGANSVATLPVLTYASRIDIAFSLFVQQLTAGDTTDVSLRLNGTAIDIASRGTGSAFTGSGTWFVLVAANATPPTIQTIFTKVSGSGTTNVLSTAAYNTLQAVVRPA